MDELGNDVIAEVERNHVQEVQVHGIIGEIHEGDLVHAPVLQVKLSPPSAVDLIFRGKWG
jgi:hypothetical protein